MVMLVSTFPIRPMTCPVTSTEGKAFGTHKTGHCQDAVCEILPSLKAKKADGFST